VREIILSKRYKRLIVVRFRDDGTEEEVVRITDDSETPVTLDFDYAVKLKPRT